MSDADVLDPRDGGTPEFRQHHDVVTRANGGGKRAVTETTVAFATRLLPFCPQFESDTGAARRCGEPAGRAGRDQVAPCRGPRTHTNQRICL
jgi:hypothetical protein